jgi:hypothetical protein
MRMAWSWRAWGFAAYVFAAWCWGAGLTPAMAQQDQPPGNGSWSFRVHGAHRSNSLHNGLASTLIRGGYVEDEEIQRALDRGRNRGRLGVGAGTELQWIAAGKGRYQWCGRVGVKSLADARWSPDALGLTFFGNADRLGTYQVLNGTQLRVGQWAYAGLGRVGRMRGLRWEALVYQAGPMTSGGIDRGYLFVSEGSDSLFAELEGAGFQTLGSGVGAGLGASWSWSRADLSLHCWVEVAHLGAVRYRPGQVRALAVDTLVETTGLAISGPGLTWEGVQLPGFRDGWAEVDSTEGRWVMLPASLEVGLGGRWGQQTWWRASAMVGDWMPWPLVTASVLSQIGKQNFAGLGVRAGGWGWVWPYAHWTFASRNLWQWQVSWEDPLSVGAGRGLGRGVTLGCQYRW